MFSTCLHVVYFSYAVVACHCLLLIFSSVSASKPIGKEAKQLSYNTKKKKKKKKKKKNTLNADTVFEAFRGLRCFTDEMEDPMMSQNSGRGYDCVKLV